MCTSSLKSSRSCVLFVISLLWLKVIVFILVGFVVVGILVGEVSSVSALKMRVFRLFSGVH